MDQKQAGSVFLSDLLPADLPEGLWARFVRLWGEACFMMVFALLVPFILGVAQGAMIALFLVSASLMRRVRQLREENRYNIWIRNLGSFHSNRLSALSIMGIFLGLFTANLLFAWLLHALSSNQQWEQFFDFLLKTEQLNTGKLSNFVISV